MRSGARYRAIGIVDDARGREQLYFHGAIILGSVREPDHVIDALGKCERPRRIFLTAPLTHFDSTGIEAILGWAARQGIPVSRLPDLGEKDAFSADGHAAAIGTIDPDDILHRPQKVVERSLLRRMIEGRRILITGAGGSIGSELARQIASFEPAELALIDSSEFNAYSIDMDLQRDFPEVKRRVYVASIRDTNRLDEIFDAHEPELVFNAAALKHVPMVERDPCEGVLTNIIGARNVADAARAVRAIATVQISTDKAVNTTNVMGATKRVAEFYCQAQDRITLETEECTRFFVVRFGNVLGSSGSLIPLFQRQIAAGGPLTVTDPRMERYFMTIGEAVQLTLLAAAHGLLRRAALGEILVLDMGKPVKIIDLARRMIRLAGLEPEKDIRINIIGPRPGEKLFEELFDAEEEVHEGMVPGLQAAVPAGIPIARLRAAILRLERAALACDEADVRRILAELVPGYAASIVGGAGSATSSKGPMPLITTPQLPKPPLPGANLKASA
jgi:O-antigen biosynthesis protein WbqV